MILNASLDTSFWTYASQVGVAPYLFNFFGVHYCQAVRNEIITTNPKETTLVYPQAILFMVFEEDGRLQQIEPQKPLTLFGVGEAHAIALAKERQWVLLTNDARPLFYARSLGITAVSVAGFCVLLYAEGIITLNAVTGFVKRLSVTTSATLIAEATHTIAEVARERGEENESNNHH
ncbi:MAG: hypothetical protein DYG89_38970 [Caldilinea sp. CFX5]|nr:hypothetical protein [Caldilinea sp. CFX5]